MIKTLLEIREDWSSTMVGQYGHHARPVLVFGAVLGAQG